MSTACNILIYGGGAVGSIFGWRVAQHITTRVSVVCRSNYEQVKQKGYSLRTTSWGDGRFVPHRVYRAGHLPRGAGFDYVVCANKVEADHTSIAEELRAVVNPGTTLVSAQNGMDVELPLRRAFPHNPILSAICNIGCSQTRPGYIQQTARIRPEAFSIGVHSPSSRGGVVDILHRDTLASMDDAFECKDHVAEERWRKLVFNNAWNSTTALTGLNTHELLQHPHAVDLVQQLAGEACDVAASSGVDLDATLPTKVVELARQSAPITPSTLQDARNCRPMELGPIFGFLVSRAANNGLHIPATQMMYSLLQERNAAFMSQRSREKIPSTSIPLLESWLPRHHAVAVAG